MSGPRHNGELGYNFTLMQDGRVYDREGKLVRGSAVSGYTEDDFKTARFAQYEDGRVAMKSSAGWYVEDAFIGAPIGPLRGIEDLAANGWRPVREADSSEIKKLRGGIAYWRDRAAKAEKAAKGQAPIGLDRLREAWEQAEVPTEDTPIREGDVVIRLYEDGSETVVWESATGFAPISERVRVLSRAPRRKPWADLSDVLEEFDHLNASCGGYQGDHDLAEFLHAKGVRVVGGDES